MNTASIRTLAIGISLQTVLAFVATTAFAQPGAPPAGTPGWTVTFDEVGNSILNGVSNPGVPIAGGGINYFLPGPVTPGFVLAQDPSDISSSNPTGDSDLLTFSNQVNTAGVLVGVMRYESLIDDTDTRVDPADVPVFSFPQPIITIPEKGLEGFNGFTYGAGNGFYNGVSDGVIPEPSSFVLGGLGLIGLAALAYRRRRSKLALASLLLVSMACGWANHAQAQGPGASIPGTVGFTFAFDELGNSLVNGGPNPNPVTFLPGGGIQYILPGPVIPGDVVVLGSSDANLASPGVSDLLSFTINTANQGVLKYFSLIDDTDSKLDPADVPSFPLNAAFTVQEFGPEGANSFQWIPFPANANGAIYNGISDGVIPEPSSFVLGGLGLVGLAAFVYRRRRSNFAIASLVLVFMACGWANVSQAQVAPGMPLPGTPGFTFTFDEFGNSLLNGGANPNPVVLMPGGGIQYFLPGPVTTGDVLVRGLSDINAVNPGFSDLLQFSNNTANQGILTYLSLLDDTSPPDPADHPNFPTTTPFGATEFGNEGINSFQWIPDPTNPNGAIYNGISDGVVPEPSTFVLGGLGLIGLAAMAYRRRMARAR